MKRVALFVHNLTVEYSLNVAQGVASYFTSDKDVKLILAQTNQPNYPHGLYEYQYWTEEENPPKPLVFETLRNGEHQPVYCHEDLLWHKEKGDFTGTAFDAAVSEFYRDLYYALTENRPMRVTPEMAAGVVAVIEKVHADNPLPMRYFR